MSRYFVTFAGREWTVDVEGDVARVVDVETRLLGSSLPGEAIVACGKRRFRLLPQPTENPEQIVLLLDGKFLDGEVASERERLRSLYRPEKESSGPVQIQSEIPGIIRQVRRQVGDSVEEGEPVLTLEAMKMENEVRAGVKGRVASIDVEPGQRVGIGEVLAVIEPE